MFHPGNMGNSVIYIILSNVLHHTQFTFIFFPPFSAGFVVCVVSVGMCLEQSYMTSFGETLR